jgi:hypothetical protein
MSFKKNTLILTAALIIPGGFVALGLWKAIDLYRKRNEDEKQEATSGDRFRDLITRLNDGDDDDGKSSPVE